MLLVLQKETKFKQFHVAVALHRIFFRRCQATQTIYSNLQEQYPLYIFVFWNVAFDAG
jgi:hypothetical protein